MSRTLLVVHHTPSPATRELLEAVLAGTRDPEIVGVDVVVRPALAATLPDVLDADGYLFGTTANFGYMSGALKYFFDNVYYPSLDHVAGGPTVCGCTATAILQVRLRLSKRSSPAWAWSSRRKRLRWQARSAPTCVPGRTNWRHVGRPPDGMRSG